MTIDEFHTMVNDMAMSRTGLASYANYLQHKSREDKYLREEYLAIHAVVRHKQYSGTDTIELGDETEVWDARINVAELMEVVQALPEEEHIIRKAVAGGEIWKMGAVADPEVGEPTELAIPGPIARFLVQAEHAHDHLQFPAVIIDAIEKKHAKFYGDERTLIVVFDGDYSFENDSVVQSWLESVREKTHRGKFKEVFLVKLACQKAFPVF